METILNCRCIGSKLLPHRKMAPLLLSLRNNSAHSRERAPSSAGSRNCILFGVNAAYGSSQTNYYLTMCIYYITPGDVRPLN